MDKFQAEDSHIIIASYQEMHKSGQIPSRGLGQPTLKKIMISLEHIIIASYREMHKSGQIPSRGLGLELQVARSAAAVGTGRGGGGGRMASGELASRVEAALGAWNATVESVVAAGAAAGEHARETGRRKRYRAWEFEAFEQRVGSFAALTWSGKLTCVDKVVCAAYGYENSGPDGLTCVLCNANVTYQFAAESDVSLKAEREYATAFLEMIKLAHKSCCVWRRSFSNNERAEEFIRRYRSEHQNATLTSAHRSTNAGAHMGNAESDDGLDSGKRVCRRVNELLEQCTGISNYD